MGLPYDISPLAKKSGGTGCEIKGTYFHKPELQKMFISVGGRDHTPFEVKVRLIPEPDNPHGSEAISVRWNGAVLGYLPKDLAHKYAQIRRIAASGYEAEAIARFWTDLDPNNERRFFGNLTLPASTNLAPLNDPPQESFTVLPVGNAIQVTKESEHLDVLGEHIPPTGEGWLLVSLHRIPATGKRTWDGVEVRLDGEPIGELTKSSSEKFIAAVQHFEALGITLLCHAVIKGSSLAAEVTLYAAKSHELSEQDLSPTNPCPLPKLVPFSPIASDYEVPPAYRRLNSRSPQFASIKPVTFTKQEVEDETLRRREEYAEYSRANSAKQKTPEKETSALIWIVIGVVTLIILVSLIN